MDFKSAVKFAEVSALPTASSYASMVLSKMTPHLSVGGMWGSLGGDPYCKFPGVDLINPRRFTQRSLNLSSGTTDLGGPASGKRWRLIHILLVIPAAGTSNPAMGWKTSGGVYALSLTTAASAGIATSQSGSPFPILENGEQFYITNGSSGTNLFLLIEEFSTDSGLKSAKLTSLSSGNNTLYTCPSGFQTRCIQCSHSITNLISDNLGNVRYYNSTGSSRTVYVNHVLSGDSVVAPGTTGTNCAPERSVSVANAVVSQAFTIPSVMKSGDFINLNTDASTSNQACWMNLAEYLY